MNEGGVFIKVDKQTKYRMKEEHINWSSAIRSFINEELDRKKNIALAVAQTYRMLEGQKTTSGSTSTIREWRDKRYAGHNS